MLFTSLNFLIFLPIVIFLYYLIPFKFRWKYLLIVSLFFYINIQPVYVVLLLLISFITYLFSNFIDRSKSESKKYNLLRVGIILVLMPLFFFKYYNFVNESIFFILENIGLSYKLPQISFLLPVGISFYTFMAIGYIIDVYNEEIKAEKNVGLITLFLSFFPLVLSGPIERATSMIPQFKQQLAFNYNLAVSGFKLILWGYFMKLVIADRLAIYTSTIFDQIYEHSGVSILLATLLYPIQIYGDLGGYSLIAIGIANIFGLKIRPNFDRPFFSISMSEFWRKWHMSLITWITDYLYTPISFTLRKFKLWGIVLALMITFIIAGIWHGATVAFIVWGAIQGLILSIEALTKKQKNAFEKKYNLSNKLWYVAFSIITTYLLFSFSFLFGVTTSTVSDAFYAIAKIFSNTETLYFDKVSLGYAFIGITMLLLSEFRDEYFPKKFLLFNNKHIYVRWFVYFIVFTMILLIGVFSGSEFIYFKF